MYIHIVHDYHAFGLYICDLNYECNPIMAFPSLPSVRSLLSIPDTC
jgi:hypothetical protein